MTSVCRRFPCSDRLLHSAPERDGRPFWNCEGYSQKLSASFWVRPSSPRTFPAARSPPSPRASPAVRSLTSLQAFPAVQSPPFSVCPPSSRHFRRGLSCNGISLPGTTELLSHKRDLRILNGALCHLHVISFSLQKFDQVLTLPVYFFCQLMYFHLRHTHYLQLFRVS